MRVLIVDDDHIICRCLQQGIDWKRLGCHEIVVSYNGAQAWTYISEHRPDIVISDVKMPVMDGKELCRLTKERFPEIAFIFLSGYEDFVTAQLAIRYNVRGYILKPLDRDSLQELERLLRDVVLQRENREFIRRIAKDEYKGYLENVLTEKDIGALEQFFDRVEECQKHREFQYVDIWTPLLQPLFGYRYRQRNEDTRYLFEQECRTEKMLEKMEVNSRLSFIKQQYMEVMSSDGSVGEDNELIWQIQHVIKEQYMSPRFNINMLGQMFQMSPTYLGRVFMEYTGMKLVDYISQQRINRACELLRSTRKSVKEVAEASGYMDSNYFAKLFRRKMQMTPLEYRYGRGGADKE